MNSRRLFRDKVHGITGGHLLVDALLTVDHLLGLGQNCLRFVGAGNVQCPLTQLAVDVIGKSMLGRKESSINGFS